MEFDNLYNVLETIGQHVRDTYKEKLKTGNHIATGKLFNSINYKLVVSETAIKLYFLAEDYWIFVENGRKPGKMPPVSAIKKWIVSKNLPNDNATAYKIARSIGLKGIKPSPYLREIKQTLIGNYRDDLQRAIDKDVKIELQKIKEKYTQK